LRPAEPAEREKVPATRDFRCRCAYGAQEPLEPERLSRSGANAQSLKTAASTRLFVWLALLLMMIAPVRIGVLSRLRFFKGIGPEHFPSAPV
jgi:hypothetical protein